MGCYRVDFHHITGESIKRNRREFIERIRWNTKKTSQQEKKKGHNMGILINFKYLVFKSRYILKRKIRKIIKIFFLRLSCSLNRDERHSIIKWMLNDDEKYLIARAIDDRTNSLERMSVNEKWIDKEIIAEDIRDYKAIRGVFSSKNWS